MIRPAAHIVTRSGGLRCAGTVKRSSPEHPLISVITVVRNGAGHLRQAIDSVIGQSWPNVEYIIIDGASTDGTREIIRE